MPSRSDFFASLFDRQRMRKRYPHRDTAFQAYLQDLGELPLLTTEQEARLLARVVDGDSSAVERLVEANLRFVIAIAASFQGRGLAMLDLIQEGNLGLLKAIKRFDPQKAGRLSTYAKYWILDAIQRAVAGHGTLIHTPYRIAQQIVQIEQTLSEFQKQGIEPDTRKIAESLGLPIEDVTELLTLMQEPLSLSAQTGNQDSLESMIVALPLFLSEDIASSALLRDVRAMISEVLTTKQRIVIEYRFGLNEEGIVYDYREIAARFFQRSDPRADESIRQLEKNALTRLRLAFEKEEG